MSRFHSCRKLAILGLVWLLTGCVAAPTVPIPALRYQSQPGQQQRNLLVVLRPLGTSNAIFDEEGLVDEIRRRGLPVDVVAPDTHLGYYQSKSIEARLKADIIEPARRQGYENIWLAGFSLGGLGCMLYARRYPEDIDGVLLTSPFLGGSAMYKEIRDAGGVDAWAATSDDPNDPARHLWTWIKEKSRAGAPPIWLGYGDNDYIVADGPPLLASVLPSERVFTVPGNHTLSTLKTVFLRHLDILTRELGKPGTGDG